MFLVNWCEKPSNVNFKIGKFLFPRYSSYDYRRLISDDSTEDRIVCGDKYNGKNSILLLGCSYTYGQYLSPHQTFAYKLATIMKKTVYNFGMPGAGTCDILRALHTKENTDYIKKPVSLVIYTYMYDHYGRCPQDYDTYEFLRKKFFLSQKYSFWDRFYIVKNYKRKMYERQFSKTENYYTYLREMIISLKKETERMFPNSKFILFIYEDDDKNLNAFHENMNSEAKEIIENVEIWNTFLNDGISVVRSSDFLGRTMNKPEERVKDDRCRTPHPSEFAWDEIVPFISDYIKRNNLIE